VADQRGIMADQAALPGAVAVPGVERHGGLHGPMVRQVKPGEQARPRRAAGQGGGHVVAEGHAFAAEPVEIRRAPDIGAGMRDEIRCLFVTPAPLLPRPPAARDAERL
jgi:hypothetical protein